MRFQHVIDGVRGDVSWPGAAHQAEATLRPRVIGSTLRAWLTEAVARDPDDDDRPPSAPVYVAGRRARRRGKVILAAHAVVYGVPALSALCCGGRRSPAVLAGRGALTWVPAWDVVHAGRRRALLGSAGPRSGSAPPGCW